MSPWGAVGLAAFCFLLVLVNPSGMGLGDAKAALGTGLVTGWIGASAAEDMRLS